MFCTKCGKENNESNNFCIYCGNELKRLVKVVENQDALKEDTQLKSLMPNPQHAFNIDNIDPFAVESGEKDSLNDIEKLKELRLIDNKNTIYALNVFPGIIGRKATADLKILNHNNINQEHVKIHTYNGTQFVVEELNAKNKSYINGYILEPNELVLLNKGDILKLGTTDFKVDF